MQVKNTTAALNQLYLKELTCCVLACNLHQSETLYPNLSCVHDTNCKHLACMCLMTHALAMAPMLKQPPRW